MLIFQKIKCILGLEPSDVETSSDDSGDFASFDDVHMDFDHIHMDDEKSSVQHSRNRLELYLLKKKLRLESAR